MVDVGAGVDERGRQRPARAEGGRALDMITHEWVEALPPADVCLIVVAFNSRAHLPGFLASLPAAADGLRLRVIVVDNSSDDETAALARDAGAIVLDPHANLGYAGGINVGRRACGGCSAVLIANPDLRFGHRAIRELFEMAVARRAIAVPTLLGEDGSLRLSIRREPTVGRQLGEAALGDQWRHRPASLAVMVRDTAQYQQAAPIDWATGAAMMINRECDLAVGDWDESFFLYSEEVDYARRARAAGYPVMFVPSAAATHAEGGSGRSDSLIALDAVNRVRYAAKWHNRPLAVMHGLAVLLELLLRIRRSGQRRAIPPVLRACLFVGIGKDGSTGFRSAQLGSASAADHT